MGTTGTILSAGTTITGTNATPPATEDRIFACSKLLQLREMQESGAPSQMAWSSTGKHLCQLEFQGTVENRSFVAGGVAFDNLRCSIDIPYLTDVHRL